MRHCWRNNGGWYLRQPYTVCLLIRYGRSYIPIYPYSFQNHCRIYQSGWFPRQRMFLLSVSGNSVWSSSPDSPSFRPPSSEVLLWNTDNWKYRMLCASCLTVLRKLHQFPWCPLEAYSHSSGYFHYAISYQTHQIPHFHILPEKLR